MESATRTRMALTPVQWLICFIASIGFAFDIYELLMGQFVFPPAISELTGAQRGTPEFGQWVGRLFYWPAIAGGIFGLLGGYLTDRLGRRRVLTWSILVYAVSAFLAGFSTNVYMLLFFRCTTFIGVCVEFVAAVAWLAELFSDPHQRERVLGYTQAFSSIGGLLVAIANGWCVAHAASFPAIALPDWLNLFGGTVKDGHAAWRYTLMTGLIPALPLIVIRPFLPESPTWEKRRSEGTLRRPSLAELFAPALRQTTIVTTIMFALAYGAAFGAIQQVPQMVPGFAHVQKASAGKPVPDQKKIQQAVAAQYGKVQEVGGLCGRFLLALLVVRIVSRRALLRLFQVPGIVLMPIIFGVVAVHNPTLFHLGAEGSGTVVTLFHVAIFVAGLLTVAQFSFWGNYLPRVYPIHLRGTGRVSRPTLAGDWWGLPLPGWPTPCRCKGSCLAVRRRRKWPTPRHCWPSWFSWSGSSPRFGCPNPNRNNCRINDADPATRCHSSAHAGRRKGHSRRGRAESRTARSLGFAPAGRAFIQAIFEAICLGQPLGVPGPQARHGVARRRHQPKSYHPGAPAKCVRWLLRVRRSRGARVDARGHAVGPEARVRPAEAAPVGGPHPAGQHRLAPVHPALRLCPGGLFPALPQSAWTLARPRTLGYASRRLAGPRKRQVMPSPYKHNRP